MLLISISSVTGLISKKHKVWPTSLRGGEGEPVAILELFCGHAQLTLEYAKSKMNVLEPRDLRFGHDLFQPDQQEKVLEEVDYFKPELVWIALPCTVWGPWTNINYKDRPQLLRRLRAKQRRLIRFAVKVALKQIEQGRHVGFEHPRNSAMWKDPSIADLLQDPLFHEVKLDMCCFDLRAVTDGELLRKPTTVYITDEAYAQGLARTCTCTHGHGATAGQNTKPAGQYTPQFARAVVRSHEKKETNHSGRVCGRESSSTWPSRRWAAGGA